MNKKLIRSDYYDEEFSLNEQEYKEFNFVRLDPYWKIRGNAYFMSLNCFGDRETLQKRLDTLLFNNYLHKKPQIESVKEAADTDIEVIVRNLKCSTGQFDNVGYRDLEAEYKDDKLTSKPRPHTYPWQVVPELMKVNRRLAYMDAYKGLTALMRNTMVFYNHFLDNDSLTGIVYLPYTPKMLDYLSSLQIYAMVKTFQTKTNYDGIPNVIDLYKQKLLDMFYVVDDTTRLHGVTPCQSQFKPCKSLASQFCSTYCCKRCCQDNQFRKPCSVHDSYEQFFRNKIQSLYNFEESKNFDRQRTIRLHCRSLVRKHDLEKAFANTQCQWDQLSIYYHSLANKIQYIYLVFATPQAAQAVYKDKHVYELKLEQCDATLQPLSQSLYKVAEKFESLENVLVVIKPLTTLECISEVPTGEEYLRNLASLVQTVTQLGQNQFSLEEDLCALTATPSYQHVFITLPSKEHADKLYNAQPYFGCVVAHKMSHIQLCPYIRPHKEMCLMCTAFTSEECVYDMCKECCSRQKYGLIKCPCSSTLNQALVEAKESALHKEPQMAEAVCDICAEKKDFLCANNMCHTCCPLQAVRNDCVHHDEPYYCREIKQLEPQLMARRMLQNVADTHIKIRNDLTQGKFDWFRPVYNTNLQESMIKANKELQQVIDNGALVRGAGTAKYKREGKVLTIQANEPVWNIANANERFYESMNKKGEPFIEYVYGKYVQEEEGPLYVKNDPNTYRTYGIDEYQKYITSPNLLIRSDFSVLITGLSKTLTIKELYQEILTKFKAHVKELDYKNIMILDNESLLTDIFASPYFQKSGAVQENLLRMGRVACVKLENILDALSIFAGEVKIDLPLQNGTTGQPTILASHHLLKFIEEFNPQTANVNILTAGCELREVNKEIETLNNEIKEMMNFAKNGGGKFGGGGGGFSRGRGGRGGRRGGGFRGGRGGGRGGRGGGFKGGDRQASRDRSYAKK